MLLTENEFKSILPLSVKNNPLVDRAVYDIIYSFNTFSDKNYGLYIACKINSIELLKTMIKQGATDWNRGLCGACRGGHMDVINLMIKQGATYWDLGLCGACQ